jgi:hypothetical protein
MYKYPFFCFVYLFRDRVLLCTLVQANLELKINPLALVSHERWDYSHVLPWPTSVQVSFIWFHNGAKSDDAGSLDMPKKSRKRFSLREKIEVVHLIKKKLCAELVC